MAGLSLENIHKYFGSVVALQNVNLLIPNGRFVCFLGPSGCGKTTLLRLVAGLEHPTQGRIVLEGKEITEQPAHQRNFGMVFQSLALFPHLSVGDNIAYSLRVRKVDKSTCRRRVEELLELVRMPGLADRHISQLSGGQRQRVAIARALAIEPRLFLLDEPLSALDAKLREDMQLELRMLHQRLGVTTIHVTHDQREAMTMSDLIVVMGTDNQVHQMGTPLEIYRNPADTFVADFIGTSNLLKGICSGSRQVTVSGNTLKIEFMPEGVIPGSEITISVRPEDILVVPGTQEGENTLQGRGYFRSRRGLERRNLPRLQWTSNHQPVHPKGPAGRQTGGQGDGGPATVRLRGANVMIGDKPKRAANPPAHYLPGRHARGLLCHPLRDHGGSQLLSPRSRSFLHDGLRHQQLSEPLHRALRPGPRVLHFHRGAVCSHLRGARVSLYLLHHPHAAESPGGVAGHPGIGALPVSGHRRVCLVAFALSDGRAFQTSLSGWDSWHSR